MDKDQLIQAQNEAQNEAYITINYIFTSMSILFSSLITITIITLKHKEIHLSDRNSLHLVMFIAIMEFFFSIIQMLRIDVRRLPIWVSFISSWGYTFSTLVICFLMSSIVINIQLVISKKYKELIHSKNYYLITSFSLAIILSLLPITFNQFTFNKETSYFWYGTFIWEWITYNGWIAFSILYCTISAIMIRWNLMNSQLLTSDTLDALEQQQSAQPKLLPKHISRILLYSLIPILSYSPSIISNLSYFDTEDNNLVINLISSIFMSLQSTFTFIVFFIFDPVIDEVISEHKRNIQHKQTVLENIKKGVYVENIYNIDRELPSNNQRSSLVRRSTIAIYNYAKRRISSVAYAFGSNERNERNNDKDNDRNVNVFNGYEDEDILRTL